jgi:hypothetical protein
MNRSLSGIATHESPPPDFKVEILSLANLESVLSNHAHGHSVAIVKLPNHVKLGFLRPFREKRCILGINELPNVVNENFLDHFCKNKTFVLFDFRSEGIFIEQAVDQILRFLCLLPIVLILVEDGVFGSTMERRLGERSSG